MSLYPEYEEQEEYEETHVTGPTVEARNRGKQEIKGNLTGAFWSSILAAVVLKLRQTTKKRY